MTWQPIETAPKDGSHILLLEYRNAEDYQSSICIGFWGDYRAGYAFDNPANYRWIDWGAGLLDEYGGDEVWSTTTPTHWQPLPEPPEQTEKLQTS